MSVQAAVVAIHDLPLPKLLAIADPRYNIIESVLPERGTRSIGMTTASILRLASNPHSQPDNLSQADILELELAINNKVLTMARAIFKGDEQIVEDWLNTPNEALDKTAPIYFLNTTAGIDRVGRVLIDIAYGFSG